MTGIESHRKTDEILREIRRAVNTGRARLDRCPALQYLQIGHLAGIKQFIAVQEITITFDHPEPAPFCPLHRHNGAGFVHVVGEDQPALMRHCLANRLKLRQVEARPLFRRA